ncbi:MAG: hypothetical protein M3159_08055 [Actinomycetota bacterium]|nr:hypothetical protein [Actinomycetota bacterium]
MKRTRSGVLPKLGALAGATAVAAAVVLLMSPAFACTIQGTIEMHPARPDPGAAVRVDGTNFNPGAEPIQVFWGGATAQTGTLLATVFADGNGAFSQLITIPANAQPGQSYQLAAVQADHTGIGNGVRAGNYVVEIRTAATAAPTAPALVDQPAAQGPAGADSRIPAVNSSPAAPSPAGVDNPVPAVVNASPYGVAPLVAGAPSPARPLDQSAPSKAFGGAHTLGGGLSPWLLLPLGVGGLSLLTGSAAYAARQTRRERVLVHA